MHTTNSISKMRWKWHTTGEKVSWLICYFSVIFAIWKKITVKWLLHTYEQKAKKWKVNSLNHQNTGVIFAVNSIRTYMYRMSVTTLTMCSSYFSSVHTLTVFHYPCTNSYGLNVIVLPRWKESILVNNNKSCYNLKRAVWWPQCLSAHWFHLNFIWQVITLFAISFSEMMW